MPSAVVVGAQWGDEGKGKIVDLFAQSAAMVVRFGGGSNAGHTLVSAGRRTVLHLVPSGILYPGTCCVLGDGMVIDPDALLGEVDLLAASGVDLSPERLLVSQRAHLVLPYHLMLDELHERTSSALGTTRRGIGPAYEDKAARRGVRVGDLLHPTRLRERLDVALAEANSRLERGGMPPLALEPLLDRLASVAQRLAPHITDTSRAIHEANSAGRTILLEGAQGALLDIDHGTYPFVTSSTTIAGGATSGGGLAPQQIGAVVGVAKAYVTRVGEGPFPTEISGEIADRLRTAGHEYGATTGRPRRCGWLDLPALRYAARLSGLSAVALTKLDILAGIHPLRVAEAYEIGGQRLDAFPADAEDLARVQPIYRELPGFDGDLSRARSFDDLPSAARDYVAVVEEAAGAPAWVVSVGAGREQTVVRRVPFSTSV